MELNSATEKVVKDDFEVCMAYKPAHKAMPPESYMNRNIRSPG